METVADDRARAFRSALTAASRGLVDRAVVIDLLALAAVAGEHVLLLGPPGTAKSEVARRVAGAFGLRSFEYLLGRFTEPSEIFGPVDLRRLKEGVVETATAGMLPEAEIAFLDEVFLGSTAILNQLLGILNERSFRRGSTSLRVPLRLCIAAANTLPDDDGLAAFADRFLVRCFVSPVSDARLEELLAASDVAATDVAPVASRAPATAASAKVVSARDLDALVADAAAVDLVPVRASLAEGVRLLRAGGLLLSDRRIVKSQRLVAAAAALSGRKVATEADLWPLVHVLPTEEAQLAGRALLAPVLGASRSATLLAAAEDASRGPEARAARLVKDVDEALAGRAGGDLPRALRLRLEALAREIDSGFAPEALPTDLATARGALVAALTPPS